MIATGMIATLLLAVSALFLAGVVLNVAHRLGNGNIWQGIKRLVDSDYVPESEENADIEDAAFRLTQRLDSYSPDGWTLELQQGPADRSPTVRFVNQRGVYNHDSVNEFLSRWSLPEKKDAP